MRDPLQRYREALLARQQGRYEEALQHHLWLHHTTLDRSFNSVRLTFWLSGWSDLATKYSPALDALHALRSQLERRSCDESDESGVFTWFLELAAINSALGEESHTGRAFLATFLPLSRLAKVCYYAAEKGLVAIGAYSTCSDYIPDALARYEDICNMTRFNLPRSVTTIDAENNDVPFATEASRLIDILFAAGRLQDARQIQSLAVTVVTSPAALALIQQARL